MPEVEDVFCGVFQLAGDRTVDVQLRRAGAEGTVDYERAFWKYESDGKYVWVHWQDNEHPVREFWLVCLPATRKALYQSPDEPLAFEEVQESTMFWDWEGDPPDHEPPEPDPPYLIREGIHEGIVCEILDPIRSTRRRGAREQDQEVHQ